MRVTEVTVAAKYSLDTGHGWKAIEVGATATLTNSDETLESAQQELYARLSHQLKSLWTNGRGKPALSKVEGVETQEQVRPETLASKNGHYCQEHQKEFRRYEKGGNVWYSHRQGEGWHNEK
jgi:hypothetical protein